MQRSNSHMNHWIIGPLPYWTGNIYMIVYV